MKYTANICPQCGRELKKTGTKQIYCRKSCWKLAADRKKNENAEIKACGYCGDNFLSPGPERKYCSRSCASLASRLSAQERKERQKEAQSKPWSMGKDCPWELGQIKGTAQNCDPVLGF